MALKFLNDGYFAGKVGIGTENLSTKLTISGQQELLQLTRGGVSDSKWFFAADSAKLYIGEGTSYGNGIKMTLTDAGKVGIGTVTPIAKLEIHTPTNSNGILIKEDTDDSITHNLYVDGADNGVGVLYANGQSAKIQLNTAGDSYFVGGDVGIGTTSPSAKTHIIGDNDAWTLKVENTQASPYGLSVNTAGTATSTYNSAFYTHSGTGMFIVNNGNVGIGTTSPGSKLEVKTSGTNSVVEIDNSDSQYSMIQYNALGATKGFSGYNTSFMIFGGEAGVTTRLQAGGSYAATILTNGNVGIGTTSPSAKLEVNGEAKFLAGGSFAAGVVFGGALSLQSNIKILNKAQTAYIPFATRNTTGSEVVMDLTNVGSINGGAAGPYLPLAGGTMTGVAGVVFPDNFNLKIGTGSDLKIFHNATDSFIINEVGDLKITQGANDKDIIFESDNGSGGTTAYFQLDGSSVTNQFLKTVKLYDAAQLWIGDGNNFQIYHNGNTFLDNYTGDVYHRQYKDNGDVYFQNDRGDGNVANFFYLDGGLTDNSSTLGATVFPDKSKIFMGNSNDLQIYHDGSNSFIDETGTGSLVLKTGALLVRNPSDASMIDAQSGGAINLYYNGSKKFETTSTGVAVTGNLTTTDDITISNTSPEIYLTNTNAAKYNWMVAAQENVDQSFEITPSTAAGGSTYSTPALQINGSTSNAIFAGDVTISKAAPTLEISSTSGGTAQIIIGRTADTKAKIKAGDQLAGDLTFSTGGARRLMISNSGVATFTGDVVVNNSLSFSTNGFADFGNTGTGAMRFKPSGNTLALTLTGANAAIAGKATSTQTAATDSSITLTTKSYVDGLVTGVPVYKGTWDARNNSERGSGSDGGSPDLRLNANKVLGNYYIVDTAGSATPNGAGTEPNSWNVGDWCIFSDVTPGAGTDLWQKIDNTSVISGAGTGQKVTKWAGAGPSETLTDGPITFSGNNSTFAGNVVLDPSANSDVSIHMHPNSGSLGDAYAWNLIAESSADNYEFTIAQGTTDVLKFNNTASTGNNNATFAGNVTIDNGTSSTLIIEKNATGGGKVQFNDAGSQQAYISLDAAEDLNYYTAANNDQLFWAGNVLNETKSGTSSTFTGNISAGSGTFSGDVNITQTTDVGVLNTTNLDNGSAVGLSLTYPTSNVAGGDGLAIAIGITGRGRSYIANSNTSNNLDASNLEFYTEGGGVINKVLTLDQNKDATFADNIKVTSSASIGTTVAPTRTLDVRGTGMSIFGTGGYTELMLRGQVEGTGTVRNVGSWHWSVRSDVGGNNDDLKLLRFVTGTYSGTSMQISNSTGDIFFANTVVNPASGFSNQKGLGFDISTGNLEVASTSGTPMTIGRNETDAGEILQLRKESNIIHSFGSTDSYLLSNVGIGNTNPAYKLSVSGGIEAGGLVTYSKVAGSLSTTGYAVAGLTTGFNGASAGFEFKCYGGNSKYQRIVYSCHCSGTTWSPGKVIDEGTNDLDVVASANGATITFTFKARSSTQSFSPRVVVQATGHSINSTYA